MKTKPFIRRRALVFKQFNNKSYSLFNALGKEVLIGVLSVSTLTSADASSISTTKSQENDSLRSRVVKLSEVTVMGSRAPLTAQQSAKIVAVITREDIHRAEVQTINDVLKLATGVDVRQRGGFGVQTDISINGGTFDQITILLNGVSVSNPQTGHNASDFPVAPDDIERIEILEGAASRVFGTAAFTGAINIVTKKSSANGGGIMAEGGSFGTYNVGAGASYTTKKVSHRLSGGYTKSDGGTDNSDFEKYRGYYNGNISTSHLDFDWQAGVSKQRYGANTFYSAKYDNQFESTTHHLLSLSSRVHNLPLDLQLMPTLYFNRFYDHYQLFRGKEGAKNGENYHRLDYYGASLNISFTTLLGKTAVGADIRKEHILSTAYGEALAEDKQKDISGSDRKYDKQGDRTNTSFYLEHNILIGGLTISAGLLANKNTGLDADYRFYPGVDISYRPDEHWKLYASWNKALRMPTWTDLYTNNVAQLGDRNLRPEKNSTWKTGVRMLYPGVEALASAFYSKGTNMIDWVYETETSTRYHALNIGKLNNMGYSLDVTLRWNALTASSCPLAPVLRLGYAYIHQKHETEHTIYRSLYALEYLRHKFTATLSHHVWSSLSAFWSLRWQQRMNGYHPYAKLDAKLLWDRPSYSLWLKADNLTCHRYYDLGSVRQPGLWIMAGSSIKF